MINIDKNNNQDCCGCNACFQICPTKCIVMKSDEEGFKYPQVIKEKCIKCNKCEKVCPIIQEKNNAIKLENSMPRAIGGWHKNGEIRNRSSSGGAFTLLAEYVLKNKGIVFGSGFNENMEVNHLGIEKIEDLDKLRGSKYVQSDIENTYLEAKNELDKGRFVLFVGTPCQTAGLNTFLNKDYDRLFTCDFICHGVPSPLVFKKYIVYLEEKYNDKIIEFKFRNKDKGWRQTGQQMGTSIRFKSGKVKKFMPAYKDVFMNGFLGDVYLRPACHECQFKSIPKKYSDITVADFWGVNSISRELNDSKGTSLILINTNKGEELFRNVKDNFYYKECDFYGSIKRNSVLLKSVQASKYRKNFFNELNKKPFKNLVIKYMTVFSWASQRIIKFLRRK